MRIGEMPNQGEMTKSESVPIELERAEKELEQLSDIERLCVGAMQSNYEIDILLNKLRAKLNIDEGSELEDILEEISQESGSCVIAAQRMLLVANGEKDEDGNAWKVEKRLGHIASAFADANQA